MNPIEVFPVDGNEKQKFKVPNNVQSSQVKDRSEVVALTTIDNFRCEMLVDHGVDSEWLLTTKEEVSSPRFQQKFSKDKLTLLCKKLAQGRPLNVTRISAPPPLCHCNELSLTILHYIGKQKESPFLRFLITIKEFWCAICNTFKSCIFIDEYDLDDSFEDTRKCHK